MIQKMMKDIPLDWFVCPVTKQPMALEDGYLCSSFGRFARDNDFGFWNFTPEGLADLDKSEWQTWYNLQENGAVSYQADPEHNLGVGRRAIYVEFAQFCSFSGVVLDIGVGPQKIPTHLEYYAEPEKLFFVGIDPLVGEQPRSFAFVQGLGEYLPFRQQLFDQVLFVTSLDHFIDPRIPLLEAKRCLKDNGHICVFLGEKDKNAPKPQQTHKWYEDLPIPEGAEDRFHFRRFTDAEFLQYIDEVELKSVEIYIQEVDTWRKNYFYRLEKI